MNWKVYALLSLIIIFGGASSLENVMTVEHDRVNYNSSQNSKQIKSEKASKWISQLFQDAERAFDMSFRATEQCRRDFEIYKMHLKNQSVWAIRSLYIQFVFTIFTKYFVDFCTYFKVPKNTYYLH